MTKLRLGVLIFVMLLCVPVQPRCARAFDVAVPHRSLWPDPVASVDQFDRASRAEILVFGRAVAESEVLDPDELQSRLHLRQIDLASIARVRQQIWARLAENYAIAAARCRSAEPFCPEPQPRGTPDLKDEIARFAGTDLPPRYAAWLSVALEFHRIYLNELIRLAALSPRISSEIETLNANELSGWELPDRRFLLTFDDGPTGGSRTDGDDANTDRTINALRAENINATFFVLGGAFEARLVRTSVMAMRSLYGGMCVGSHGWLHRSHGTWSKWQESALVSSKLIRDTVPQSYVPLFRPPYGQRRTESGEFFADHGLRVALWNIDSQDWVNRISAEDVEQRVITLMLLWRRGVILFHDVHGKAHAALPRLVSWVTRNAVEWIDCRRYPSPGK
jgi:peptidoglycan/xylan/chitin deacetylase (PgdA/CDA1 family)